MGAKLDPHQQARLPARQCHAQGAFRQHGGRALDAEQILAKRMLLKIPLVDVGGGLSPAIEDLHRVIAALDLRNIDQRAALLVEPDPGLAVDDIEIRVRPVDAAGSAVDDLVPLEAFLEIEVLLAEHQQAAEHVFVSLDDVAIGETRGGLRTYRRRDIDRRERCKRCEKQLPHGAVPPRRMSILNLRPLLREISTCRPESRRAGDRAAPCNSIPPRSAGNSGSCRRSHRTA